mmetsp:Transcript_89691/g.159349  ORF Transcript_89691/g.159349 Transcript_89691/m.159349 type:complete len:201 (+) Transcript_89691:547-1149(+)
MTAAGRLLFLASGGWLRARATMAAGDGCRGGAGADGALVEPLLEPLEGSLEIFAWPSGTRAGPCKLWSSFRESSMLSSSSNGSLPTPKKPTLHRTVSPSSTAGDQAVSGCSFSTFFPSTTWEAEAVPLVEFLSTSNFLLLTLRICGAPLAEAPLLVSRLWVLLLVASDPFRTATAPALPGAPACAVRTLPPAGSGGRGGI